MNEGDLHSHSSVNRPISPLTRRLGMMQLAASREHVAALAVADEDVAAALADELVEAIGSGAYHVPMQEYYDGQRLIAAAIVAALEVLACISGSSSACPSDGGCSVAPGQGGALIQVYGFAVAVGLIRRRRR